MKNYETPDVKIVPFHTEDVVTASSFIQPGFSGWAPDSDDSEFG